MIEFHDVSIRFEGDDRDRLSHVDFTVPEGEGPGRRPAGSGKSTLLRVHQRTGAALLRWPAERLGRGRREGHPHAPPPRPRRPSSVSSCRTRSPPSSPTPWRRRSPTGWRRWAKTPPMRRRVEETLDLLGLAGLRGAPPRPLRRPAAAGGDRGGAGRRSPHPRARRADVGPGPWRPRTSSPRCTGWCTTRITVVRPSTARARHPTTPPTRAPPVPRSHVPLLEPAEGMRRSLSPRSSAWVGPPAGPRCRCRCGSPPPRRQRQQVEPVSRPGRWPRREAGEVRILSPWLESPGDLRRQSVTHPVDEGGAPSRCSARTPDAEVVHQPVSAARTLGRRRARPTEDRRSSTATPPPLSPEAWERPRRGRRWRTCSTPG